MYIRTYVRTHACTYAHTYVRMHVCMYACMHVCMYLYMYVCLFLIVNVKVFNSTWNVNLIYFPREMWKGVFFLCESWSGTPPAPPLYELEECDFLKSLWCQWLIHLNLCHSSIVHSSTAIVHRSAPTRCICIITYYADSNTFTSYKFYQILNKYYVDLLMCSA